MLLLIEIAQDHAGRDGDATRIRPFCPGQHAQQGTFARPVWPDDDDAAGSINRDTDPIQHSLLPIAFVQVLATQRCAADQGGRVKVGVDFQWARWLGNRVFLDAAQLFFGRAHVARHGIIYAHGLEVGDEFVIVARGAVTMPDLARLELDRLAQFPDFFLLLPVTFYPLDAFLRLDLSIEIIAATVVLSFLAVLVYFDNGTHGPVKKVAVMRDCQQPAAKVCQELLQPGQGAKVQMIGRLIKQQQIRLLQEQRGQPHA